MCHGGPGPFENVVGTFFLVGSNEVRIVDAGKGLHRGHLLPDESLEGRLQDLSTIHGLGKIHATDIPSSDHKVIRVNHGKDIVEGNVDFFASLRLRAELHGGSHDYGAIVVGGLRTFTGIPSESSTIGNDTSGDRGTIVATPAYQHHAHLAHLAVDLEVIDGFLGSRYILAGPVERYIGGAVGILGLDFAVGVNDVGRIDREEVFLHDALCLEADAVGVTVIVRSVRSHRIR